MVVVALGTVKKSMVDNTGLSISFEVASSFWKVG